MKTYGGSGSIAPPFFTWALDGGEWSASRPRRFTPRGSAPGTHRRLGEPRANLDAVEKKKSCTAVNRTRAVQPVARRYTDWAIRIRNQQKKFWKCSYASLMRIKFGHRSSRDWRREESEWPWEDTCVAPPYSDLYKSGQSAFNRPKQGQAGAERTSLLPQ
jgi:hypothetical protein